MNSLIQVSNIIGVIQGIAEQTNLLALNAAIEAARAGDHGRGFSVVADEVRALSLNTQQATEEIRALLDSLHTRAGTAVNTMQKGRIMAQENVELSEQVYRLIETVSSDIDRINQLNLLIATATEEQAQVTHITRENLTNISQATTRTEDSARSNSDASRSLEQQSEQLRKVLAQFKL
ncbi:methyl-accepting chemotaxis protein [Pontibacterium sp.]|uniref:methyl-accepting chemotaxis protein n=1 Tax=Pontibacterium sp. TaxID=2036026 RepID=UPI0035193D88